VSGGADSAGVRHPLIRLDKESKSPALRGFLIHVFRLQDG
jgi:hypothetical protein